MNRCREGLLWLVPGPLVVLLVVMTVWMFAGISPEPATSARDRFSAVRAMDLYDRVFGPDAPHPAASRKIVVIRNALAGELARLGMTTQMQDAFQCGRHFTCARLRNVAARFGPEGRRAVMLVAHHDSVPAGPGASDDAINVAVALEATRWYRDTGPYVKDLILLFSDAEELGLLGAEAFASEHAWMRDVDFIINLEARGTRGPSFLFEISGPTKPVIDGFSRHAGRPFTNSVAQAIYELMPNDTDLSVFKRRAIPGVNFAFLDGVMDYHTPNDDRARLSLGSIQHQGDNCLAVLRGVLVDDQFEKPAEEAVFFDVMSLFVVVWPEGWTPWIAGLVNLFWIMGVWLLYRRSVIGWAGLLWGGLAWITALLGSGLLVIGVMWTAGLVGMVPSTLPFPDQPVAGILCGLATGMLAIGLVAGLYCSRANFWEFWTGTFGWWLIFGSVVSLVMEKASYIFVVPGVFTLVGLFGRSFVSTGGHRWWTGLACLPLLVAGALFVPMIWTLYTAMGLGIFSPMLLSASIFMTLFLPFLGEASRFRRWIVPGTALVVGSAAFVWGWFTPVYSPESPQHVNIVYRQQGGEDGNIEAGWWVQTFGEALPGVFSERAEFDRERKPIFPTFHPILDGYRTSAQIIDLPVPEIEVIEEIKKPQENQRVLRLLLTSGRQADAGLVAWSKDEKIAGAMLEDRSLSLEEIFRGWRGIGCYAGLQAGLRLELIVEGMLPVTLWFADLTYGLPEVGLKPPVVRPDWMKSFWGGDATLSVRRFVL